MRAAQAQKPTPLGRSTGMAHVDSNMPDRSRELKPEGCAAAFHTVKFDSTIMQLHGPVRHRQADAGAFPFGGEVKLEHLVAQVRRNAGAGVGDLQCDRVRRRDAVVSSRPPPSFMASMALVTRFSTACLSMSASPRMGDWSGGRFQLQSRHAAKLRLRRHQIRHFARQRGQVHLFKLHLHRPREIQKSFHHAIQPPDFFRKNVDLLDQFLFRARPASRAAGPDAGRWRSADS